MKFSYIVQNPQYSLHIPMHAFDDYHELIIYIRKNKIDGFVIWCVKTNEWYDSPVNISSRVYSDAWNEFEDYRDKNY